MIYTNENMNLFWTTKKDVYNYTRNLTSVVYSFCWRDSMPTKYQWPFMLEETFYVGLAGGQKEKYIADRKESHRQPCLTTRPHQRMKKHLPKFDNPNGNFGDEKRKYELYHSLFTKEITKDKTFYIALLTPKEHVPSIGMRNLLSLVESEQMYQYQKMFGYLPYLNLAEADNSSDSLKKDNSISQKYVKTVSEQNLEKFMVPKDPNA